MLKKIFQLRDKTHQDEEKPFLEHLEDLRVVITRLVLTLVIAMSVCFVFRNELMEIIRRPVEQVWQVSQQDKMPKGPVPLDLDTWEMAKKAARDISSFTPAQREHYYKLLDPDGERNLKFHTETVVFYRAAIDMENTNGKGEEFIEGLPGLEPELKEQLTALMVEGKQPDAAVDSRGKLVLMQALNPTEGFMLSIKLSLVAGIVISFPLLLLFTLQFILPGLKSNEKRAMWPAMIIGFGLFLTGVLFSYYFVLPKVLDFFYNYSQEMGVTNEWRIGYYISFATQFTLIFGLSFELPVVVMTMVKLGILNYEIMKNTRSYAILAIVVIAAIITPTPDAFTLLLLAGPMVFLYEICIWLAYFHRKKEREAELAEQEELRQKLLAAPPLTAAYDEDGDDYDSDSDGPSYSHDDYFDHDGDEIDVDEQMEIYRREHEHLFDHDEDEGDEEDNGTYDFGDDELDDEHTEVDYTESYRPEDSDESEADDIDDDDDDDIRKHDGSKDEERSD
ncbi:twin-arginine translocase subunit TatC [Oceaniferula spumae]|uniref:twin-arginine translocase subunit TatC n=1 Tax=Oceaniferula spumae TaxID=2979115 RepID=UPI003F4EB1C4